MDNEIYTKEGALVLFSGGQDSTTCLFWALKHFSEVRALCITYGQKHSLEATMAKRIARNANVPFQLLDVPVIGQLANNSLTNPDIQMDEEKPETSCPNTFVPGRNMFFLTFAAVIAQTYGFRHIVTGVSQTDFSGYPDCRDTFIRSINVSLNLAMEDQFVIHTPLMWLDKMQTWEMADKLGVFDVVRNETLTCYNGIPGNGCGHCPACKLRQEGLDKYLNSKTKEGLS